MTDTQNTQASEPNRKKRLSLTLILFILSFALNLFFVGLLVGLAPKLIAVHDQVWHDGKGVGEHRFMGPHMGSLRQVKRGLYMLPDEMKQKMREQMKSSRTEIRPVFRELHENSRETIEILKTSPLDVAALQQNFDKQNELRGKAERLGQTSFIAFLESLNDEEKAELSKALKEVQDQPWRGHKHKKWRDHHQPKSDGELNPPPED